jgi:hypothetical protein
MPEQAACVPHAIFRNLRRSATAGCASSDQSSRKTPEVVCAMRAQNRISFAVIANNCFGGTRVALVGEGWPRGLWLRYLQDVKRLSKVAPNPKLNRKLAPESPYITLRLLNFPEVFPPCFREAAKCHWPLPFRHHYDDCYPNPYEVSPRYPLANMVNQVSEPSCLL